MTQIHLNGPRSGKNTPAELAENKSCIESAFFFFFNVEMVQEIWFFMRIRLIFMHGALFCHLNETDLLVSHMVAF